MDNCESRPWTSAATISWNAFQCPMIRMHSRCIIRVMNENTSNSRHSRTIPTFVVMHLQLMNHIIKICFWCSFWSFGAAAVRSIILTLVTVDEKWFTIFDRRRLLCMIAMLVNSILDKLVHLWPRPNKQDNIETMKRVENLSSNIRYYLNEPTKDTQPEGFSIPVNRGHYQWLKLHGRVCRQMSVCCWRIIPCGDTDEDMRLIILLDSLVLTPYLHCILLFI